MSTTGNGSASFITSMARKPQQPTNENINTPQNQHIQTVGDTPQAQAASRQQQNHQQLYGESRKPQTAQQQQQQQQTAQQQQQQQQQRLQQDLALHQQYHPGMGPNQAKMVALRAPATVDTLVSPYPIPHLQAFGRPVDQKKLALATGNPDPATRPQFVYDPRFLRPVRSLLDQQRILDAIPRHTKEFDDQHRLLSQLCKTYHGAIDQLITIKDLPALPAAVRKSPIPPKRLDAPRLTLALDLDETLAHCSLNQVQDPSCQFTVKFQGQTFTVHGRIRPHLEYFLRQVSQWYEIVIFTASQKSYADSLLNIIDPMNQYITHRVFRDSCVHVEGAFLKDLTVLGRPLEHVVILDNSIQAFGFQLSNGIPCETWYDDQNDVELLNLIPLLRHLKDVQDVRPYLREFFGLQEFVDGLSKFKLL